MQVQGEGAHGILNFTVVEVNDRGVVLDANHPMAGKNLISRSRCWRYEPRQSRNCPTDTFMRTDTITDGARP